MGRPWNDELHHKSRRLERPTRPEGILHANDGPCNSDTQAAVVCLSVRDQYRTDSHAERKLRRLQIRILLANVVQNSVNTGVGCAQVTGKTPQQDDLERPLLHKTIVRCSADDTPLQDLPVVAIDYLHCQNLPVGVIQS